MQVNVEGLLRFIRTAGFPTLRAALNNPRCRPPSNYAEPTLVEKPGKFVLYNVRPEELSEELFGLFKNHGQWLLHGGYPTAASNERGFVVEL